MRFLPTTCTNMLCDESKCIRAVAPGVAIHLGIRAAGWTTISEGGTAASEQIANAHIDTRLIHGLIRERIHVLKQLCRRLADVTTVVDGVFTSCDRVEEGVAAHVLRTVEAVTAVARVPHTSHRC